MVGLEQIKAWEEDPVTQDIMQQIFEAKGRCHDYIKSGVMDKDDRSSSYWCGFEDALNNVLVVSKTLRGIVQDQLAKRDRGEMNGENVH